MPRADRVPSARRLADPLPGPLPGLVRRPLSRLRHRWRRSIALRVVATTLAVAVIVVAAIGALLLHQVGKGILDNETKTALVQFGAAQSQAQLQVTQSPGPATDAVLESLVVQAASLGRGTYGVVLLTPGDAGTGFDVGGVRRAVPEGLRRVVVGKRAEATAYVRLTQPLEGVPGGTAGSQALVIGAPLTAPSRPAGYELYFVFPLSAEQQTLSLVQGTLEAGGLALVLLFAVIAALVTRQVVTPVRQAARVASRLSAGRLQERMVVRGEDDVAKLATAFNEMARGLQRQIGELEELSRVQRRFTADVSHELRTPLTTVRMAADMLFAARADFAPEISRSAELLVGQLDRFEALLVDLLEISRYDARAAVLEPEATDIGALLRREAAAAVPLAVERGCTLVLDGLPSAPVLAEVDPRRVARIVRNLLSNAVEHAEGRPVLLELAADDEAVALRVRDHGVGLRPGEASLVFGRFWRADPSRARRTGGTGLGLSIAQEDARLHGGWLQAWGEPGLGASFRLVLPRRAGAELRRSPLTLEPADAPLDDELTAGSS